MHRPLCQKVHFVSIDGSRTLLTTSEIELERKLTNARVASNCDDSKA
jgi:hypothetical protein